MLSPDELAAEENRYRIRKILTQSPRFHSQLGAQLCWKQQPGKQVTNLLEFDRMISSEERRQHEFKRQRALMVEAISDLTAMMDITESYLRRMHQNTGSITLISNQSARPLICPPEAIGRYKKLVMTAKLTQEFSLLEKLMRFDSLICSALLLRKFGFLTADHWDAMIKPITEQWRELFNLAEPPPPATMSGSEFFGIQTIPNQ